MNIWENAVLTDKGTALQAKLIQGQTLKISRVTTGSKKVPIVDLRQQTDVTEGGYDITLQPSRTEGEKTILPVLLENTSLKESYDLWQVGFFAEDPEEGEILYCLAQASEAKHIPSATEGPGFSITWDFVIKTSNTTPFEVDLDSVGLVSIEQYQVHTGEIHSLKNSIVNLDRKFEDLNSALETEKVSLNSYISAHKIQKTAARNYTIGTELAITPSSSARMALVLPTFGSINSYSYNVQMFAVSPNTNTLIIPLMPKNDGTIVRSGNVDLEVILLPWE